jgi:hypothetical protein
MKARHEIPPERRAAFDIVAETSKTKRVLVACRTRAVRRQYERAILALGGNLDNVDFHLLSSAVSSERTPL